MIGTPLDAARNPPPVHPDQLGRFPPEVPPNLRRVEEPRLSCHPLHDRHLPPDRRD